MNKMIVNGKEVKFELTVDHKTPAAWICDAVRAKYGCGVKQIEGLDRDSGSVRAERYSVVTEKGDKLVATFYVTGQVVFDAV